MSKKAKKGRDFVYRAYYEGGTVAMQQFINENLQYPQEAFDKRVEGTVRLLADIDYKGVVNKVKVLSGIGFGCDEEAVRIAELMKFEVPKTHQLRVAYKKKLNIHFKLKSNPKPKRNKLQYHYTTTTTASKGYTYSIKI